MQKNIRNYIITGIICIPLFFINVRSWSDWGDDFAQYMQQANNIISGIPQNQTGYIYNEDFPTYAPQAYPAGFPLLLAPVIKWKGNSIYHLNLYISLFLFLFAIMLTRFLSRYFSDLISVLAVILIIYNPWTLAFKADIVSDIPFTLFLLVLLFLYTSQKKGGLKFLLLFSAMGAFTLLIRSVGIALMLAILLHSAVDYFNYRKSKSNQARKEIIYNLALAVSSFTLFFILNKFIFPVSEKGLFNYNKIIDSDRLFSTIQTNLNYYTGVLRAFFEPWNDKWQFITTISGSMIFTLIILGMIRKMALQYDFLDSFFVAYFLIIVVYPYSNAGFRFLFPLTPLLLIYFLRGIMSIHTGIRYNIKVMAFVVTLIVLFSYKKGISEVYKSMDIISEGPQVKENEEMFRYVIDSTETDARFSFKRPRALSFYTGRSSVTHRRDATTGEIEKDLVAKSINYILINRQDFDQNMEDYIRANDQRITKVWENSLNTIYKINPVSAR